VAGLKQRFGDWRAGRQARRAEERKRIGMDPRPGLIDAKRDEQTKLQERSPRPGGGRLRPPPSRLSTTTSDCTFDLGREAAAS
jgi:hypothetical protein